MRPRTMNTQIHSQPHLGAAHMSHAELFGILREQLALNFAGMRYSPLIVRAVNVEIRKRQNKSNTRQLV
jgi:hypothetical protein